MGLLSDGGGMSNFLNYKHGPRCFYLGKEDIVEFDKLVVDVDSVKTGWGIFTTETSYQYVWDERPGVRGPKPDNIDEQYWTGAFSMDCYIKDTEESVIWRHHSVGNARAFDLLTDTYLDRLDEKKPGQVGAFISLKQNNGHLKVGYKDDKQNTSWPLFEFHSWIDRPEQFVSKSDMPSADPVKKDPKPKPEISDKDIPF